VVERGLIYASIAQGSIRGQRRSLISAIAHGAAFGFGATQAQLLGFIIHR